MVTRSLPSCESCAIGKAKQKNVPKVKDEDAVLDKRSQVFLDIATIKPAKDQAKPAYETCVEDHGGPAIAVR